MVMKENPKYAIQKIHAGMSNNQGPSKEVSTVYKSFIINGKPDFEGLKLDDMTKWRKLHGLTAHQKRDLLANDPNYSHAEETRAYGGPQGIFVAYLNHKTGIHQVDINVKGEDSLNVVKSMFEMELGVQMYDVNNPPEDLEIKLKKIKSK
jgi:hypothetical protein